MVRSFKTVCLEKREKRKKHAIRPVAILIYLIVTGASSLSNSALANSDIEFNADILDLKDKQNIDLSDFSRAGYIMPGRYEFVVRINNNELPDIYNINYVVPADDPKGSEPCLPPELVRQLGLKPEWLDKIRFNDNQTCLDTSSIPGMTINASLGSGNLLLTIPQAYLEYSAPNWDPPSRWDDGISGILFDYNVNANVTDPAKGKQRQQVTGLGTLGANLGAWRFRADWQASYQHTTGIPQSTENSWKWNQYYLYRAIPQWEARFVMGETYSRSDIFDSFRFTGVHLATDDNMLPPNLRGYAPEVTGVAKTNAKVTISQQGRVIYETQVAPGPFRIQDINDAVSGKLDVRVEEQDGSVQEFQMDTASIPYLTRPGRVQYKFSAGKPSNIDHNIEGPVFGMGEFSWGVSNGWSLYGGSIVAGDYNALSAGIGRDLMAFGALSFDATHSWVKIPRDDKRYNGGSYRLSYSKRFEAINSQVTFAGYRFSERDFMTMDQYLERRYRDGNADNNKELYTIMFSKQFPDWGLSTYLNYSHQTYWNKPTNDNYNLSLAKSADIGRFKNINFSLSAFRNKFNGTNDNGVYMNVSMPWGDRATISYNTVINKSGNSHNVSYYDRIDDNSSYRVGAGVSSNGKPSADAYFMHYADAALVTASASHINGEYTSATLSLQGGATLTPKGGALHRVSRTGSTRLLIDTDGIANIPVKNFGAISHTNMFGKAVLPDINDYYRSSASIDLNRLPENVEALRSIQQLTLTEGAIGYRRFDVIEGQKAMAVIRLKDGTFPPFGASVTTEKGRELGIINDGGNVYLTGINTGDVLSVRWSGKEQCKVLIPTLVENVQISSLLLTCSDDGTATSTFNQREVSLPKTKFLSR